MNQESEPSKDSIEAPSLYFLVESSINWIMLIYHTKVRDVYMFPYIIAFPYVVFMCSNIAYVLHVTSGYYSAVPLVHKLLEQVRSAISPFALVISILESAIFFSIKCSFPDKMFYYTTLESGQIASIVFIRVIPLLLNITSFRSTKMSFNFSSLFLTVMFFPFYYSRLCAYLSENNGKFVHHFLDLIDDTNRIFLFFVLLPVVSVTILWIIFYIRSVFMNKKWCTVIRQLDLGHQHQ